MRMVVGGVKMPVMWFSVVKASTSLRVSSSTRWAMISYMDQVFSSRSRMSASSSSRIRARLEAMNSSVGSG